MVRRSGTYVQDRFPERGTDQTLPLTIETMYSQRGAAVVNEDGVLRPERKKIEPRTRREFDNRGQADAYSLLQKMGLGPTAPDRFYRVDDDAVYTVAFAERVRIPKGHVGIVQPRESLRSSGVLLNASYVEPGEKQINATLFIEDQFAVIAEDAKIADLAVVEGLSR